MCHCGCAGLYWTHCWTAWTQAVPSFSPQPQLGQTSANQSEAERKCLAPVRRHEYWTCLRFWWIRHRLPWRPLYCTCHRLGAAWYTVTHTSVYDHFLVLCRGYMWSEIIWNNIEIILVFYFTRNHWQWLRVIYNTEIISKLFQRHWTCWKIFMSCNKPLK